MRQSDGKITAAMGNQSMSGEIVCDELMVGSLDPAHWSK
jgi:hypothetical protein